jgi:hypothetical protein
VSKTRYAFHRPCRVIVPQHHAGVKNFNTLSLERCASRGSLATTEPLYTITATVCRQELFCSAERASDRNASLNHRTRSVYHGSEPSSRTFFVTHRTLGRSLGADSQPPNKRHSSRRPRRLQEQKNSSFRVRKPLIFQAFPPGRGWQPLSVELHRLRVSAVGHLQFLNHTVQCFNVKSGIVV